MAKYIHKQAAIHALVNEANIHNNPIKRAYTRVWRSVSVGNGIMFCSVCRNEAYWDTDYGQQLFDYCPYCGAKMIKDGEHND